MSAAASTTTLARPRARHIPALLEAHAADLAFVCGQRRAALHDDEHTQRSYADLCERLEAHVQGLLCAPAEALLAQLQPDLAGDDADGAMAAALALLRRGDAPLQEAVLQAFGAARGARLQGLCEAFALAPASPALEALQPLLAAAPSTTAAAVAAPMAQHRRLPPDDARLTALLRDADPATQALAWRAARAVDAMAARGRRPRRELAAAVAHADARVRDAAWSAAAWSGTGSLAPTLRERAAGGDAIALRWLAVLGSVDDVPLVQRATLAMPTGRARCELIARHGHPSGLNALVRWMAEADEGTQVAAGEAFEKITGLDVRGERREITPPEDADDFTRAMAPLAWFPDADRARTLLLQHTATWSAGQRWRRGHCLDAPPAPEATRALDMQARWDIAARSAWAGGAAPVPPIA
jgi:hypothetical protein